MDRANSEETHGEARQAHHEPQRRHNELPSRGKPDRDQEFQIHQGVTGKQHRQIDRQGLHERHHEQGDRDEFDHLAEGQPIKEGGELNDQDLPERI